MPTVTKAASSNAVVTTGWTNPTNAYGTSADGTLATAAPGKNSTINSDFGFPAFTTSDIPAGSTINSVTVNVGWKLSATGVTGELLGVQLRNSGGTALGTETTDSTSTATTTKTQQVTSGISLSDLQTAGVILARVRCSKGNTTTSLTGSLDYVSLTVDYTAPASGTWSVVTTATDSGSGNVGGTTRAVTLGAAVSVGDVIVVLSTRAGNTSDASSDSCADNLGNSYTNLGGGFDASDSQLISFHVCVVANAGTPTITLTYPASWQFRMVTAVAYRSVTGAGALDTSDYVLSPATTQTPTSPSITPTADHDLVVGLFQNTSNSNALSAGSGFTSDATVAVSGPPLIEHKELGTGTSGVSQSASASVATSSAAILSATVLLKTATATTGKAPPPVNIGGLKRNLLLRL